MSLLTFLVAALALAITPGPGIAYVVARTVAGGHAEGLASCFGTAVGGMLHVLAAATGLSLHAERNFQAILPLNPLHAKALSWVRTQLWALYDDLKAYKQNPHPAAKRDIEQYFDELCRTRTTFQTLNQALKRLRNNKAELLLVLERPDIPLHNNLSERDIREYVIRRKISGSTRSDNGRRCRDTFASLKKTCSKLGIGFWDYLLDRINLDNRIRPLPALVAASATHPP